MIERILHFWALPPFNHTVSCPPPIAGDPADPSGALDPVFVSAAYSNIVYICIVAALLGVIGCYLLSRSSLSNRFVIRWWWSLGLTSIIAGLATFLYLKSASFYTLAGSCSTQPAMSQRRP
jgi:hypothetical protein